MVPVAPPRRSCPKILEGKTLVGKVHDEEGREIQALIEVVAY
jgi:hypothetical protein